MEQFLEIFGGLTVSNIVYIGIACGFCFMCYKQVKKFFEDKFKIEKDKEKKEQERDENIKLCLAEIAKYPTYREQSIKVQQSFENQIHDLKVSVDEIQNTMLKREKNKLYDKLIQNYKYYTSKERNPMQAWSDMEATAFWGLFEEYEDAHGDGFIHSVVQPAMKLLTVIPMEDEEGRIELAASRK